jgi:hypothetical protein
VLRLMAAKLSLQFKVWQESARPHRAGITTNHFPSVALRAAVTCGVEEPSVSALLCDTCAGMVGSHLLCAADAMRFVSVDLLGNCGSLGRFELVVGWLPEGWRSCWVQPGWVLLSRISSHS